MTPAAPTPTPAIELFPSGTAAYAAILDRVQRSQRSIDVRAFVWCDDEAGNRLGEALLEAAERGVRVRVFKDRIAAVYEYMTGTHQSFFHKRIDGVRALQAWAVARFYGRGGPVRQDHNRLASALLAHANVTVEHRTKRFDHAKVFVFDDTHMVLGSMGIADHHRHHWYDMMVAIDGPEHVERLAQRLSGAAAFDRARRVDFLVHRRGVHERNSCELAQHRLALIDSAERTLTVEMAYMGDRRFTDALVRAAQRGVEVLLVTSRSDVLGHVNLATCKELLKRTAGQPMTIVLADRMVHAKVIIIDGAYVDIGSANFTRLSHGVYDEVNAYLDDPELARRLEQLIRSHAAVGAVYDSSAPGAPALSLFLERAVVAWQSRNSG